MTRVHPALLALLIFLAGLGGGLAIGVIIGTRANSPVIDAKALARDLMEESRRLSEEYRDSFSTCRPVETASAKREVLFYHPGNEAIFRDLAEIPAGDGLIKGRVLIDGKPGSGLQIALIIAVGRRTVSVALDADGNYSIPIPRGTYNLNGFLIEDPEGKIADHLLVNHVEKRLNMFAAMRQPATERLGRQFSELRSRMGAARAAAAMRDSFSRSIEAANSFQFVVGEDAYELPDLRYNSTVQILLPPCGGELALADIKFVWQPYSGAADYDVCLARVVKNGNSTSFPSTGTARHVTKNELTLAEWRTAKQNSTEGDGCAGPSCSMPGSEGDVQAGGTYALEIIARDSEGRILSSSRSDPHDFEGYMFRVSGR